LCSKETSGLPNIYMPWSAFQRVGHGSLTAYGEILFHANTWYSQREESAVRLMICFKNICYIIIGEVNISRWKVDSLPILYLNMSRNYCALYKSTFQNILSWPEGPETPRSQSASDNENLYQLQWFSEQGWIILTFKKFLIYLHQFLYIPLSDFQIIINININITFFCRLYLFF